MKAWIEGEPWTSDMLARLEQLYGLKLPYSKIASTLSAEIGATLSRSAVAGMVLRMNLPKRGPPPVRFRAMAGPHDIPPLPPAPAGNTLLDLEWNDCRWPVRRQDGEWQFCRKPKLSGRPYCSTHIKQSYVSTRR